MENPAHKDGDTDSEDLELELVQSDLDVCTWTSDPEEKRRAFVVNLMAHADIDGRALVENMNFVCEWLKTGNIPGDPVSKLYLKLSKQDY